MKENQQSSVNVFRVTYKRKMIPLSNYHLPEELWGLCGYTRCTKKMNKKVEIF